MRKALFALLILCFISSVAYAGQEQYSRKEMKQVAPPPSVGPSWTGFYIGGFGGYKYGAIDPSMSLGGDWAQFPGDARTLESRAGDD